jgi:hypothetical protein
MTREMLSCRDHAVILDTANERRPHPRRQERILAVRSSVDHRVIRIVVDVQNRSVRDVNSERSSFHRREAALLVSERRVTSCAHRHLGRKHDCPAQIDRIRNEVSAARAKAGASFQIRTEQEWDLRHRLKRVELGRDLCRRSDGDREPADLVFGHILGEKTPLPRITRYVVAIYTWPYYLSGFLTQSQ